MARNQGKKLNFALDVATYQAPTTIRERKPPDQNVKTGKLLRAVLIGFGSAFFLLAVTVSLLVILGYGSQKVTYDDHKCNNFHSHACKMWKMDKRSGKDLMTQAHDLFYKNFIDIASVKVQSPNLNLAEKLKTFFQICMDEDGIEAVGLKSLIKLCSNWPLVNDINWHGNESAALRFLATMSRILPFNGLFSLRIGRSINSTGAAVWLFSINEEMNKPHFTSRGDYEQGRQEYTKGIFLVLKNVSKNKQINAKMATQVENLVDLEEALAEFHRLFNKNLRHESTLRKFSKETKINWIELASIAFRQRFPPKFPLVIVDKINTIKILRVAKQNAFGAGGIVHLSVWSVILQLLPHGDSSARKMYDFIQTSRRDFGISTNSLIESDRTQFCADTLLKYMPWVVVAQLIPDLSYTLAQGKIVLKYILKSIWHKLNEKRMNEQEKNDIRNKLTNLTLVIGGPDWLENANEFRKYYQYFPPLSDDHLNNVLTISKWNQQKKKSRLSQHKLYEDLLFRSLVHPLVKYSAAINTLIIAPPALVPPIFQANWSLPLQYGILGTLIAHELIHLLHDTVGDNEEVKAEAIVGGVEVGTKTDRTDDPIKCLKIQYNDFCPLKELKNENEFVCVNGDKTLEENIADNGAVRHSYYALKNALKDCYGCKRKMTNDELQKYSDDELFFYSYAKIFCPASSISEMEFLISNSRKSPREYRTVGPLSNFPQFAKTFRCSDDHSMNRKNRCEIW